MTAAVHCERERLSQAKFLNWIRRDFSPSDMIPVYWHKSESESESESESASKSDVWLHCALIPNARVEQSLKTPTWDLTFSNGRPGVCKSSGDGGDDHVRYSRLGFEEVAEPFVFHRNFHGLRPEYVEVSEEFRLFHNLYHDRTTDTYLKLDGAGNESVVIVTKPGRVEVRLLEIRQYLAARGMHFAIVFDNREHSRLSLEELSLEDGVTDRREGLVSWGVGYGDLGLGELITFSRLLGKRLFPPLPKERCGIWPFDRDTDEVVDFIIDVDEAGAHRLDTAAEYGGKSMFLTPVSFRKSVLDKYYAQPGKYLVEGGYVRCGSLWGMPIDNHHEDYVIVWLGDLHRDLPFQEQLHWRSHNVPRAGPMSKIFVGTQLDCQFLDSDQPEHTFGSCYEELSDACHQHLGWHLLVPLAAPDAHYLRSIRVPATDEQKDFDELILGLTKILIDSLHEGKLSELIASEVAKGLRGGIAKLEAALDACGVTGRADHIKFMRSLQNLRSTGSAHRKGSSYQKAAAEFGVGSDPLRKVFREILRRSNDLLEFMKSVVTSGKLHSSGTRTRVGELSHPTRPGHPTE